MSHRQLLFALHINTNSSASSSLRVGIISIFHMSREERATSEDNKKLLDLNINLLTLYSKYME